MHRAYFQVAGLFPKMGRRAKLVEPLDRDVDWLPQVKQRQQNECPHRHFRQKEDFRRQPGHQISQHPPGVHNRLSNDLLSDFALAPSHKCQDADN